MINDNVRDVLLGDLHPSRVSKRKQGSRELAYVEAWDIKRTLTRVFDFGGWSWQVITADVAFEEMNEKHQWHVGYKVLGSLSVPALECVYSEAAVGFATLPSRGEAHDMAVKSGESDALKRAAINLGTQFGLSLYNNGSLKDVVGRTVQAEPVEVHGPVILAWRERLHSCETEEALSAAWNECKQVGLSHVVYSDLGRSLLDDVNERLAVLRGE